MKIEKDTDNELMLYIKTKTKKSKILIEAMCKRTSEGFVVLKDSMIELVDSDSLVNSVKDLRDKCRSNNEIINGKIIKDYLFNSPSYAAMFVLGMRKNGRTIWKNKEGITLKDIEEKEIRY